MDGRRNMWQTVYRVFKKSKKIKKRSLEVLKATKLSVPSKETHEVKEFVTVLLYNRSFPEQDVLQGPLMYAGVLGGVGVGIRTCPKNSIH